MLWQSHKYLARVVTGRFYIEPLPGTTQQPHFTFSIHPSLSYPIKSPLSPTFVYSHFFHSSPILTISFSTAGMPLAFFLNSVKFALYAVSTVFLSLAFDASNL